MVLYIKEQRIAMELMGVPKGKAFRDFLQVLEIGVYPRSVPARGVIIGKVGVEMQAGQNNIQGKDECWPGQTTRI